jgi:hypothetical protein
VRVISFGSTAPSVTLDMTGNWWGTTDIPTITTHIYDNSDGNSYAPLVNFLPMLNIAP